MGNKKDYLTWFLNWSPGKLKWNKENKYWGVHYLFIPIINNQPAFKNTFGRISITVCSFSNRIFFKSTFHPTLKIIGLNCYQTCTSTLTIQIRSKLYSLFFAVMDCKKKIIKFATLVKGLPFTVPSSHL